jgi:hypothetical protein
VGSLKSIQKAWPLSTGFWKKQAATEQALPPALLLQQAV